MFPRQGMSFETWRWDTLTSLPWRVYSLVSWQSLQAVIEAGLRDVRSLQMKGLLTHRGRLCYGTNHTAHVWKRGFLFLKQEGHSRQRERNLQSQGYKGSPKTRRMSSGRILRSCEMRPGWNWMRTSPTSVGSERKVGVYPEGDREQRKGFPQY